MDGEDSLGPKPHALLSRLREYSQVYGRGAGMPLVGTTEQCEREIEVEEENEAEQTSGTDLSKLTAASEEDWANWQAVVHVESAPTMNDNCCPVRCCTGLGHRACRLVSVLCLYSTPGL